MLMLSKYSTKLLRQPQNEQWHSSAASVAAAYATKVFLHVPEEEAHMQLDSGGKKIGKMQLVMAFSGNPAEHSAAIWSFAIVTAWPDRMPHRGFVELYRRLGTKERNSCPRWLQGAW